MLVLRVAFLVLILVVLMLRVAIRVVVHARDLRLDILDLALRLLGGHQHRRGVREAGDRLAHRLAFRVVARSVLEAYNVHRGNAQLGHELLAFEHDVQRSVSVLVRIVLAVPVVGSRQRNARQEGATQCRHGPNTACGSQSPNVVHLISSSRFDHGVSERRCKMLCYN